jgi:hypothetical protein
VSRSTRPLGVLSALLALLLCACAPASSTTDETAHPSSAAPTSSVPAPTAPATTTGTPQQAEPVAPTQGLEPPPSPTAAAGPEASPVQTESPPTRPAPPEPLPLPKPGTGSQEVPDELLEQMVADLAARLQVRPEEITMVKAEAVVWRDGSLGCPKPGMMYTQSLVPGYQAILEVGGRQYDYHADQGGYFFLCQRSKP